MVFYIQHPVFTLDQDPVCPGFHQQRVFRHHQRLHHHQSHPCHQDLSISKFQPTLMRLVDNLVSRIAEDQEMKENQVKETQTKENQIKETQVKETQIKENQIKDNQIKEYKAKENPIHKNPVTNFAEFLNQVQKNSEAASRKSSKVCLKDTVDVFEVTVEFVNYELKREQLVVQVVNGDTLVITVDDEKKKFKIPAKCKVSKIKSKFSNKKVDEDKTVQTLTVTAPKEVTITPIAIAMEEA